jgi:hypothetical protein
MKGLEWRTDQQLVKLWEKLTKKREELSKKREELSEEAQALIREQYMRMPGVRGEDVERYDAKIAALQEKA